MTDDPPRVCRPVIEYRCVKCNCFHRAELDQKFRKHLRHAEHTRERPPTANEVLARLALEPED